MAKSKTKKLLAAQQPPPPPPAPVPAPVTIVAPEVPPPTVLAVEEPVRPPEPPAPSKPLKGNLAPADEIAELEKRIASDQERIRLLQNPIVEFPKIVNNRRFESREEQDAAGPDFADKAK